MRLWRCLNCKKPDGLPGVDFFADKPECPTCKLGQDDPRFGGKIVACRIVHFDPPHPAVEGAGQGHLACDPQKKLGKIDAMATGDPGSVNCPLCRATKEWADAKATAESGPDSVPLAAGGLAGAVLANVVMNAKG